MKLCLNSEVFWYLDHCCVFDSPWYSYLPIEGYNAALALMTSDLGWVAHPTEVTRHQQSSEGRGSKRSAARRKGSASADVNEFERLSIADLERGLLLDGQLGRELSASTAGLVHLLKNCK